jgi:hypothetical protein
MPSRRDRQELGQPFDDTEYQGFEQEHHVHGEPFRKTRILAGAHTPTESPPAAPPGTPGNSCKRLKKLKISILRGRIAGFVPGRVCGGATTTRKLKYIRISHHGRQKKNAKPAARCCTT